MSKPTKKTPAKTKPSDGPKKTLAERDEEAIERMVSQFVEKREDKPVDKYLRALVKLEGSDLHMKVGKAPIVRVNGTLKELKRDPIGVEEMARLLFPMMSERTRDIFDEEGGADFAYTIDVDGVNWRFRVNMLQQLGKIGLVARRVNNFIPDFRGLHLPPTMETLCHFDQGMILLAGVTGSGKSTTIASMLNYINTIYSKHILTLEDPIEFVFTDDKCLINQREVGIDVVDFGVGMKHAVREDPDPSTIGRILDLFPEDMHGAIRGAIAMNMKAIVAQKLLKSINPDVGRVPTCEIMTFNPTVKKLILESRDHNLSDAIRIGYEEGMQDFTKSLKDLIDQELIDRPTAFQVAPNKEELKMKLKGINVSQPGII